jgi:micrococcal nuclease
MKYRKLITGVLCAACLVLLIYYCSLGFGLIQSGSGDVVIDETKEYLVTYVVDGDTFKARIGTKEITVRILGINSPETVDPRKPVECYGPEASDKAKTLLAGKSVILKSNPNRERRDKYGRYLLYVYEGNMFVNEFLIENGFAREYTVGRPYSFQQEFKKAEGEAQVNKKGLWGKCAI